MGEPPGCVAGPLSCRVVAIEQEDRSGVAALFAGETLAQVSRAEIIATGTELVPELLRTLVDPELVQPEARGGGYAPVHAAELLAELGAVEAIPAMLEVLARTDPHDFVRDRIVVQLPRLGVAVVEPVIAAHDATTRDELRDMHCQVLSRCGVLDERIRERLEAAWARWPELAVMMMGHYGDPTSIPFVERTFARLAAQGGQVDLQDLIDAGQALADLDALGHAHRHTIAQRFTQVSTQPPESLPEIAFALISIGDEPIALLSWPSRLLEYAQLLATAWNVELFERSGDTDGARRELEPYRDREDAAAIERRLRTLIEAKRALHRGDPRAISAVAVQQQRWKLGLAVEGEIFDARWGRLDS